MQPLRLTVDLCIRHALKRLDRAQMDVCDTGLVSIEATHCYAKVYSRVYGRARWLWLQVAQRSAHGR